ncbi:type I CRISPR-associated protein Cas7 [Priestia endophytica]
MACRGLYVFSHESPLGNAPSHQLFEKIDIKMASEIVARSYRDYKMTIDENLPEGVELNKVIHSF